jgi:Cdc6-like AAA superfamily ATPase
MSLLASSKERIRRRLKPQAREVSKDNEVIEFEQVWARIVELYSSFGEEELSLPVEFQQITRMVVDFLNQSKVDSRKSEFVTPQPIIITGKPGRGKTTFLHMLSLALPESRQFVAQFGNQAKRYHNEDTTEIPYEKIVAPGTQVDGQNTRVIRLDAFFSLVNFLSYNPSSFRPFDPLASSWLEKEMSERVIILDELSPDNGGNILSWAKAGALIVVTSNQSDLTHLPRGTCFYIEITGEDLRVGTLDSACISLDELEASFQTQERQSEGGHNFVIEYLKLKRDGSDVGQKVAKIDFHAAMRAALNTSQWTELLRQTADGYIIVNFPLLSLGENIEYDSTFIDFIQKLINFFDAVESSSSPVLILLDEESVATDLRSALQFAIDKLNENSSRMSANGQNNVSNMAVQLERAVSRMRAAGARTAGWGVR